jgi:hypothetical protein
MDGGGIPEDRLRTALNGSRTLVAECEARHDCFMGNSSIRSTTLDLFSTASAKEPAPSSINSPPSVDADWGAAAAPLSYSLPTNLPSALKHLDDNQLNRLLAAVKSEQKRRGNQTVRRLSKQRVGTAAVNLTSSKINAICAAFKAGVSPLRIAKQFGVSQSDVRKALASDRSKI